MKIFITPLLSLIAVLTFTGTAFASVTDYTNYFTFDEGTGWSVGDSVGGQNGSLTGTSTGFGCASGQAGTALGMDGKTGESVVLPNGFLAGSQGSIVLWFSLNDLTDSNILFSGKSTSDYYIYAALRVNYEGRPEFLFRTTTTGADQKAQGMGTMLNKNEWYQLVLTANAVGYRMFVNGEEISVAGDNIGRWIADLTNHTFMYRIGSLESYPLSGTFNGYIDDLRFYNRALTPDDVTVLYNGGDAGTPDAPLAAKQALAAKAALAVASSTPVTNVVLEIAPAQTATTVAQTVTAASPGVTTATAATETSAPVSVSLKAKIQELIDQILLLIAELQRQLAALKAQ